MLQEREDEAQAVVQILAQLGKKWNSLRMKLQSHGWINQRLKMRSVIDVERGNIDKRVGSFSTVIVQFNCSCTIEHVAVRNKSWLKDREFNNMIALL